MSTDRNVPPDRGELGMEFDGASHFEGHLATATERVAAGVPHALLVVKLDRVREVSHECGREAETALFDVVRHTLHMQLGSGARASRIPPDRLAILQPGCLLRDARALGKRVRTALDGGQFLWHGLCFRLGASVGVLEMTDPSIQPADQVAQAIRACDAAVNLGGIGVVVTTGDPDEQAEIDAELRWRDRLSEVI